ncbi:hypothetical protein TRVL_08539 [Trypanosoma vivax]|nr:hypothetical protein TRVL_08539 [Trypanosoma vivax]
MCVSGAHDHTTLSAHKTNCNGTDKQNNQALGARTPCHIARQQTQSSESHCTRGEKGAHPPRQRFPLLVRKGAQPLKARSTHWQCAHLALSLKEKDVKGEGGFGSPFCCV